MYIIEYSIVIFFILVPSGPPLGVAVISHTSDSLAISWKTPEKSLWNGKLTGYRVCYSVVNEENRNCFHIVSFFLSLIIPNLQPSTKYLVTVAASTKIGFGNKSSAISKITNGGKWIKRRYTTVLLTVLVVGRLKAALGWIESIIILIEMRSYNKLSISKHGNVLQRCMHLVHVLLIHIKIFVVWCFEI